MHFLIENQQQFDKLSPQSECFVQVIPSSYSYHPKLTNVSLVYYRNIEKGYIFAIKHSETTSLDVKRVVEFLKKHDRVFVLDRKYHSYFIDSKNLVDVKFEIQESKSEFKTPLQLEYEKKFSDRENCNELIPVTKHYEHLESVYEYYKTYFYNCGDHSSINKVVDAYFYVENNRVGVKDCFFDEFTVHNKKHSYIDGGVYTHYNMYNQTGRPTNTFNGVNFLAIPKEDHYRTCIIPKTDYLVEYDFDGYHIRLIANELGVELPKTSIHEYLGKQYFQKPELTEEEYKQSKTITFRQLYGGVMEEYRHIELFYKMESMIDALWRQYNSNKVLRLPTGTSLFYEESMTPYKVFNYYVQNLETKNNSEKIIAIRDLLVGRSTELVLITYDAFLFDFKVSDGKELLCSIKDILESGGFPVKHKYGKDYILQQN
jgi:hypothetical protein